MLVKKIKYIDYNGNPREEDYYFNISKSELAEMELSIDGGYSVMMERIVAAQNLPELMKNFKQLILKSYGVKSPDGKRFIKSEELSTEFMQTEAYDKLFMELITDTKAAIDFANGIMPKEIAENAAAPANLMG
ncbi:MAG: hypothetical protein Q4C65_02425 [Eubacteriales bacterium]|nr:hypothetical protein [Eubacteriales bacterium]